MMVLLSRFAPRGKIGSVRISKSYSLQKFAEYAGTYSFFKAATGHFG